MKKQVELQKDATVNLFLKAYHKAIKNGTEIEDWDPKQERWEKEDKAYRLKVRKAWNKKYLGL